MSGKGDGRVMLGIMHKMVRANKARALASVVGGVGIAVLAYAHHSFNIDAILTTRLGFIVTGTGIAAYLFVASIQYLSGHGYTMQAIAEFAGLHHSKVSLLIKDYENNPRFKG